MLIKAVIFDLDGTITEPLLDFDAIRKQMGLPADAGPVWEAMEKMDPLRRQAAEKVLDLHERNAVEQSKLNSGAKELLQALAESDIKIGILTRNTKSNAMAVAEKHGLFFDVVVGREDGPLKPDAFGVLKICETFGISPKQAIVVGDYLFDLLCAKAAGACAVLFAIHKNSSQFAQHADFTIQNLGQVLEIIENKNRDSCL